MNFNELNLIPEILKAITKEGYTEPSPIQQAAIPVILSGSDLLASAQTGTGKTAAFAMPIIQKLLYNMERGARPNISALILAPTRELAEQIKESFNTYGKFTALKVGAIYGGVAQRKQEIMVDKGVDVLIATPGRLIDLLNQRILTLSQVGLFVLDEADTMLDMGFIKDVKKISSLLPKKHQTLLFSATISKEVGVLAQNLLVNPVTLEMAPPTLMLDTIKHQLIYVEKNDKRDVLLNLLQDESLSSVLVFTKTKHYADKLAKYLVSFGVKTGSIHGDKTQNKRQQALNDFKNNRTRVLIATDIAARGIDIEELSHVINFDLPLTPETYVHRIGRTGRAGLEGAAITLCSEAERFFLKQIKKHTGLQFSELTITPISEDFKTAYHELHPPKVEVKIAHQSQKRAKDKARDKARDKSRDKTRDKDKENRSQAQNSPKAPRKKVKTKSDPLLKEALHEEKKKPGKTTFRNKSKPNNSRRPKTKHNS